MVKLNEKEQQILNNVKNSTWFYSYQKEESKAKTKKLISKIRRGIKKGKFIEYYPEKGIIEDNRGHKEPQIKKEKKTGMFKPVKNPAIRKNEKERTYTPQTKAKVEKARIKYPNATNYELRHGVNSKASKAYRERHKMPDRSVK